MDSNFIYYVYAYVRKSDGMAITARIKLTNLTVPEKIDYVAVAGINY